jgi:hypothetical protein
MCGRDHVLATFVGSLLSARHNVGAYALPVTLSSPSASCHLAFAILKTHPLKIVARLAMPAQSAALARRTIQVARDDADGAFVRVSTTRDALQVFEFLVRPVRCRRRQDANQIQLLVLLYPTRIA